jgi:hypothetical protein
VDLPSKPALAERRSRYDAVKAAQAAQLHALDADARAGKRPREEDEAYVEARARVEVSGLRCCVQHFVCSVHCPEGICVHCDALRVWTRVNT